MDEKEKINLGEALKQFYSDEPLKINLAASVADKVFAKQKTSATFADKWVFYLVVAAAITLLIFLFRYLLLLNISPALLLLTLPVLGYYWLSAKEVSVLSHKYMQLG